MSNNLVHPFASAKADGPDATLVRPSNWNAGHNPFLAKTNRSGSSVAQYGYVVTDSANNDSFTTTTTASDPRSGFVVQDAAGIANAASGSVMGTGWDTTVLVQGNVTRGNWLVTSTTATRLADSAVAGTSPPPKGAVGIATSSYAGGGAGSVTMYFGVTGGSLPSSVAGDIFYASGTDVVTVLAKGTAGQFLTMNATATAPSWVALRSYLAGLKTSNNGADAVNDIDIAVGMATDSTNVTLIRLTSALTKQLDAAWAVGTNAGMLATGVAIANTTYFIFLIMRPDTGVVDIAADTSATGANITANTNAAYTIWRRISAIRRSGGTIVAYSQLGDEFLLTVPVGDYSANNPGTGAVSRTLSVPVGIQVHVIHAVAVDNNDASNVYGLVSALDQTDTAPSATVNNLDAGPVADPAVSRQGTDSTTLRIRTNTSGQIRTRLSSSSANVTLVGTTFGWVDTRGRDE